MGVVTIHIRRETKRALDAMKSRSRETYTEVLERLLEDLRELNTETRRRVKKALREIRSGKVRTHDEVKAEMGF